MRGLDSLAKKVSFGLVLAAVIVTGPIGWEYGRCQLANIELRDDMHDLASQLGTRIGLNDQRTEGNLRDTVVQKAAGYGIALRPDQVFVDRTGTDENTMVYLAARYERRIVALGFSFTLHFHPESGEPLYATGESSRHAGAAGATRRPRALPNMKPASKAPALPKP